MHICEVCLQNYEMDRATVLNFLQTTNGVCGEIDEIQKVLVAKHKLPGCLRLV